LGEKQKPGGDPLLKKGREGKKEQEGRGSGPEVEVGEMALSVRMERGGEDRWRRGKVRVPGRICVPNERVVEEPFL